MTHRRRTPRFRSTVCHTVPTPGGDPQFVSAEIGMVNGSTVAVTFDRECVTPPDVTIKENGIATTHDGGTIQGDAHIVYYIIPIPWHGSDAVITVDDNAVTNNITWLAELQLVEGDGETTNTTPIVGAGTIVQTDNVISGDTQSDYQKIFIGDRILADDASIDGIVISISPITAEYTVSSSATVATPKTFTIIPQATSARVSAIIDQSPAGHDFSVSGASLPAKQVVDGQDVNSFKGLQWMLGESFANNPPSMTIITVAKYISPEIAYPATSTILSKINDADNYDPGWIAYSGSVGGTSGFTVNQDENNQIYIQSAICPAAMRWVTTFELIDASTLDAHIYINGSSTGEENFSAGSVTNHSNAEPVRLGASLADINVNGTFNGIELGILMCVPAPPAADRAAIETRLGILYAVPAYL